MNPITFTSSIKKCYQNSAVTILHRVAFQRYLLHYVYAHTYMHPNKEAALSNKDVADRDWLPDRGSPVYVSVCVPCTYSLGVEQYDWTLKTKIHTVVSRKQKSAC